MTDLVERCEDVCEIGDGPAGVVDLMKDKVAKELDDVPIASLGPARVVVKPEGGKSARISCGRDWRD